MTTLQERLRLAFETEYRDHAEAIFSALDAGEASGWSDGAVDVSDVFRRLHSLKGASRAVDRRDLEAMAHKLEDIAQVPFSNGQPIDAECAAAIRDGLEKFIAAANGKGAPEEGESPQPATTRSADLIRVESGQFDALLALSSDLMETASEDTGVAESLGSLIQTVHDLEIESADERIREVRRTLEATARAQRDTSGRILRLAKAARSSVVEIQSIAADAVFGGARGLIRDLAESEGKTVRVSIRGLETVADRFVLTSLKDPVSHLLRNAVHHGIEPAEARRAAGKPSEGRVALTVALEGATLVVSVEDDGRGLDTSLAPGQGDGPVSLDAVLDVVSREGVSTETSGSEIAGRGLGLAIARKAALDLGGRLGAATGEAGGTRFELRVPAHRGADRYFVLSSAGRSACVPAMSVNAVHRIPLSELTQIDGGLCATSPPIGISTLHSYFKSDAAGDVPHDNGHVTCVELDTADERLGIAVDETPVIVSALRQEICGDVLCSGAIATAGGTVVPVFDAEMLAGSSASTTHATVAEANTRASLGTILVVDDSLTTRSLERAVLEDCGYTVRICTNGVEALASIREARPDVVVSDVEMPEMDGFGLLAALRRDPAFASLPFVLMTSRAGDEDRNRGMKLGADAYMTKQNFDQTEFLRLVERLV